MPEKLPIYILIDASKSMKRVMSFFNERLNGFVNILREQKELPCEPLVSVNSFALDMGNNTPLKSIQDITGVFVDVTLLYKRHLQRSLKTLIELVNTDKSAFNGSPPWLFIFLNGELTTPLEPAGMGMLMERAQFGKIRLYNFGDTNKESLIPVTKDIKNYAVCDKDNIALAFKDMLAEIAPGALQAEVPPPLPSVTPPPLPVEVPPPIPVLPPPIDNTKVALLESQLATATTTIQQLKDQTSLLNQNSQTLQAQLDNAKQEKAQLQAQLSATTQQLVQSTQQLNALQALFDAQKQKLEAAAQEREILEHKLADLQVVAPVVMPPPIPAAPAAPPAPPPIPAAPAAPPAPPPIPAAPAAQPTPVAPPPSPQPAVPSNAELAQAKAEREAAARKAFEEKQAREREEQRKKKQAQDMDDLFGDLGDGNIEM